MNSIPTGWTKNRMKYCVTLNPSYSKNLNDSDSISFIPMECLTNGYICPKTDVVGRVKTGYTFFADGDIIMAKVTPCFENGNIAIVHNLLNGVGFGTSELYVFRSKTLDTTYLFYYLQNDQFKQLCIGTMYGTGGLKRVSLDFIRNYTLYVPPFPKQQQIASFLDAKSSLIDSTIEKEREIIDKLKEYRQAVITEAVTKGIRPGVPMKDSGVEWIGEIPEGWDVCKIKYHFEIIKRLYYNEDRDVLSVTQHGLKIKDIQSNKGQLAQTYAGYQLVHINDFVMNHMDLLTGSADCSKFEGVTSPDYRVFRLRDKTQGREYYKYLFQMYYKNRIFYGQGQGVSFLGRWRLQTEVFKNMGIIVPPLLEQQEIADYIDKKCSAIDATIQKRELAIEKLTQYKQSLIYECVTGKREVAA